MSETQDGWRGPPSDSGVRPGAVIRLSKYVWRGPAGNAGPMTGPGTNSYLVGAGADWTAIDPGPADDGHISALLASTPARRATVTGRTQRSPPIASYTTTNA